LPFRPSAGRPRPALQWTTVAPAAGLLAAATYRVNDRLSIGPGFGVFSELEDETDWGNPETAYVTHGHGK